jgi:hypothetical protein
MPDGRHSKRCIGQKPNERLAFPEQSPLADVGLSRAARGPLQLPTFDRPSVVSGDPLRCRKPRSHRSLVREVYWHLQNRSTEISEIPKAIEGSGPLAVRLRLITGPYETQPGLAAFIARGRRSGEWRPALRRQLVVGFRNLATRGACWFPRPTSGVFSLVRPLSLIGIQLCLCGVLVLSDTDIDGRALRHNHAEHSNGEKGDPPGPRCTHI